jgi:hypothetical protein
MRLGVGLSAMGAFAVAGPWLDLPETLYVTVIGAALILYVIALLLPDESWPGLRGNVCSGEVDVGPSRRSK